jgi:hypothetical protein
VRKRCVGGDVAGVCRRSVARGVAGVERSRVGGGVAGVGNRHGGARRGAVRRRAIGDGTAGVGRSHVGAAYQPREDPRRGRRQGERRMRTCHRGGAMASVWKSRVEDGANRSAAWTHRRGQRGRGRRTAA